MSYLCAGNDFFLTFAPIIDRNMKNKNTQVIFDKNTVEFVTVAAEVCGFLERAPQQKRKAFVDTALKLLPLLYLKASLLPPCERVEELDPEKFVTEDAYNALRASVAVLMGGSDDYLEVFVEDMKYSDTPIRQTVSESMADIYQALRDFIGVYQLGFEPTMNDALVACREQFAEYWGQCLVNVMRALHEVKYSGKGADAYADTEAEDGMDAFAGEACSEEELYEGLEMGEDDDE